MTRERMVELLKIEHECMLRASHDDCDRNCLDCELCQDDSDLHEMYTNVIWIIEHFVQCKDCRKHINCDIRRYINPIPSNWFCGDGEPKKINV